MAERAPELDGNTLDIGTPWEGLSFQDIQQLLPPDDDDSGDEKPGETNRLFYDGDHWQDGEGWDGPAPRDDDGDAGAGDADRTWALLEEGFKSRNVIAEVTDRHGDALLGSEPSWGFVPRRPLEEDEEPSDREQTQIDEAEALITEWWDRRGMHEIFTDAITTLLLERRACLRLYVPSGLAEEVASANGEIRMPSIAEALELIYPDHPLPNVATVATDEGTKRQLGILLAQDEEGKDFAEIVFLDENREQTVIQTVQGDGRVDFPLDLGGRLTMMEVERPPFITSQVRQSQRSVNLAKTVGDRNVITAGFLERVLLNAQMPGQWVLDEKGARKEFIPYRLKVGPGTTTFYTGVEEPPDANQVTRLATPTVNWRPPVPITPSIEAKDASYRDILSETDQLHTLIAGDATSSGISRVHARADFVTSVRKTAIRANRLGRWLVETVLAFAEALAGKSGLFTDDLTSFFDCIPDYGPITADEREQNNKDVQAGTLSQPSAMIRNGVSDPDREQALILASPEKQLDLRRRQIEAAMPLVQVAGSPVAGALEFVGVDPADDDLDLIEPEFEDPPPPAPGAPGNTDPNNPPPPGNNAGA